MHFGADEKKKYELAHSELMKEIILEKKGDIDALDWIVLGKHYVKNGEEQIAFICFH